MPHRAAHPSQREGQSFDEHQNEMARWCGYPDAAALNADHDRLHVAMAFWLGVTSNAMRMAVGADLTREEAELAGMEEDAVLSVQRYMRHAGGSVPAIS
jgi:hypothetical protein